MNLRSDIQGKKNIIQTLILLCYLRVKQKWLILQQLFEKIAMDFAMFLNVMQQFLMLITFS